MKHRLALATLVSLTTSNLFAETDEEHYFLAASECAKGAQVNEKIKLNSGVYNEQAQISTPLTIDISREMNEQAYLECMKKTGLLPDTERDPYLQRIRECNQGVTTERTVVGQGEVRIGSTRNQQAYEDCLRGVEVELLPPEE